MPVDHILDPPVVVVRMTGDYSTDELKDAIRRALSDPDLPEHPVLMFDLRASAALESRTTGQVRDMARFLASLRERFSGRLAMVTGSDVGYGLMRIGAVEAESGGIEPAVFRCPIEARDWLVRAEPDDQR